MITLQTGLPGSGKTLHLLQMVRELSKKEARPVYYDGITILHDVPNNPFAGWVPLNGKSWVGLPAKSIIVIDECQVRYRPRGLGVAPPDEVQKMETHRHEGYDIFLATQHPMLIDSNVRRLCGAHFHNVRNFGMQRSTIHEWIAVKEQCDKFRGDSVRHEWSFPKGLYQFYKSAEAHTHKRRLPMRVWLLIGLPLFLIPVGYKITQWFIDASNGKKAEQYLGVAKGSGVAASGVAAVMPMDNYLHKVQSGAELLGSYIPRVPDMPQSAPRYDELAVKAQTYPMVSACIESGSRCKCYSQQGSILNVTASYCHNFANAVQFRDTSPPDLSQSNQAGVSQSQGSERAVGLPSGSVPPSDGAIPVPSMVPPI